MSIEVSIICKTYNHEQYIEDAILSFIAQKTSFRFEIIIHDDASTDDTQSIIRRYESKYPNLIKAIYQKENTYSAGINANKQYIYPHIKGKYVSFCEGDDFWSDNNKLQKQYEFMEKHNDYTMCFHGVQVVNNKKEPIKNRVVGPVGKETKEYKLYDVGKSGFVHLSSMFLRAELLKHEPPEWVYSQRGGIGGDVKLAIYTALKGRVYYIDEIMSSYRTGVNNSLMDIMRKNYSVDMKLNYENKVINLLEEISRNNKFLNLNDIDKLIKYYKFRALKLQYPNSRKELKNDYNEYFSEMSETEKVKLIAKKYFPKSSRLVITFFRGMHNE